MDLGWVNTGSRSFQEERSYGEASEKARTWHFQRIARNWTGGVVRASGEGVCLEVHRPCGLLLYLKKNWNLWTCVKQVGNPIRFSFFKDPFITIGSVVMLPLLFLALIIYIFSLSSLVLLEGYQFYWYSQRTSCGSIYK